MKREVVQDFLNLPGIAGVALMDGRSRPYFYGIDQTLNFQQKETLSLGIHQVIETTPADFEFFEFQFSGHQIYIYKLDHEMILLVLTREGLVYEEFAEAVEKLKAELRSNYAQAIATFRLLAGTSTLTNSVNRVTNPPDRAMPPAVPPLAHLPFPNGGGLAPTDLQPKAGAIETPSAPQSEIRLKDLLVALNQISEFTQQYLGAMVVANYFKSTRPPLEWLTQFEIDRTGKITLTTTEALQMALSVEQYLAAQEWIAAFSKRCTVVIRDFPTLIQQLDLGDRCRSLLTAPPAS
jgi:hypothetical protein